jgi:crossover junction endodeoxyribonuclease RusA
MEHIDVVLYLPWPPTVNNYYKVTRHGQRYLAAKVRSYRELVEQAISEQAPGLQLTDPLFCEVYLYPPDRRKRDLDNSMKGLLDAITNAGLWEDDSQLDQLHIFRGATISGGAVKIELTDAAPIMPLEAIMK